MILSRPHPFPSRTRRAAMVAHLACRAAAGLALAAPASPLGAQPPRLAMPSHATLPALDARGGQVGRVIGRVVGQLVTPVLRHAVRGAARRAAASRAADAPPLPASAAAAPDPLQHEDVLRDVVDAYVAAAARGDVAAADSLLHPTLRARADAPGGVPWPRAEVLAFFAERPALGGPTTVAEHTDARGQRGLTYYLYAAPREGGTPRPVVLTVVREDGRARVAAVHVDRLVVGRHR